MKWGINNEDVLSFQPRREFKSSVQSAYLGACILVKLAKYAAPTHPEMDTGRYHAILTRLYRLRPTPLEY